MTINKRNLNLGQWYSNAPKQEEPIVKSEEAATEVKTVEEQEIQKSEQDQIQDAFANLDGIQKSEEKKDDDVIQKSEEDELQKEETAKVEKSQTEQFSEIMKSFHSGELKNNHDQTVDSKEEALQIALEKSDLQGALGFTGTGKVVFDDLSKSEDFSREDHLEASLFFKSQFAKAQNSIQTADLVKKSNFHQTWADLKFGK